MERPRRACTSRKRPSHDVTDDGSGRSDCDASREVDPADASGSSASVNDSKGNLSGTSNALYKSVIERNKQIKNVQNSPSEHIPDEWQVYAKTIICTHGGKHRYRGKGKRPRQEVRPMGCTTQINAGVQVVSKSPVKFAVQLTRCGRLGQRLRVFWSSSWRTQTAAPLHKTDYWTFGRFVAIWVVYLWTCPTKRIATCITLQTKHMVDIFSRFPEVLMIDATHVVRAIWHQNLENLGSTHNRRSQQRDMVCKEDWRLLRSEKWTAILQCEAVLTNPAPPPAAADSSKRKRVHTEETPTLIPNADQPQKSKGKKKRGQARDTAGSEAPRSAKQPKTGNKKARQTKKQLRELEDKRRRAMSSFGTIWAPPHHDGNDRPQEDVVIKPNPEHQTDLIRKVLVLIRKRIHVTRRLDPVDGLDSDDDTSEKRPDSATSVGTPTSEETSTTPAAILFDQGVDLDPNLVVEDSSAFLDSDAEGSGDELTAQDEVSPDASSDESESDSDDDGWNELNIKSELERVKILLSAEEQEQLHLRVQESSPLYDNSQLADMAATGWAVRPVNSVVTIEDDVEVDSVYDGYCGPTPGSSACGLSPGALFYYSYRKRSGGTLQANQIATGGIRLKKLMRKSKQ
ncbi:hypothetical protein PC129_g7192 [Phytophthora cactorum]|uniref:ZSWIM1/3 RNaseH-like domain-containing protein n=1 Tax=Phytophthora cactorum TaxID=29920 RepID=A0A8T1IG95_9STRA|nr:hypothetical protein PC129_g7192 [Phytophthora cactorum]